jgi:heme-degrading monooxygenase HmoA
MILEIAHLRISPGSNAGFESAFEIAQTILAGMRGYLDHHLYRCIEQNDEYRLLVHWKTVEDHTVGFRESASFANWRALLQPFFATPPTALHYDAVTAIPA